MQTEKTKEQFTRYEIARIIGARALQIAMDAPLLLKISDKELEEIKYDPLKIAEMELNEEVLPITIHRPIPRKKKDKLLTIKKEIVSDEELIEKEQEVEKEMAESSEEIGLVNEAEQEPEESSEESSPAAEQ